MRNNFNFFTPSSINRLRFYKLKLTGNEPVSAIRARLFANPQFRTSKFKFALVPISDFGSKSFYTGFSYKYFLSKWKKFEHKKTLINFFRPIGNNFPNLAVSHSLPVSDYRTLIKQRAYVFRRREFKVFTTRSRFFKRAYFRQYFNKINYKLKRYVKFGYKRKASKKFIRKVKRRLFRRGLGFSKKSLKFFPFFRRKKLFFRSFFPTLFKVKRRYGRINKRTLEFINKWFRKPKFFSKGYRKNSFIFPRIFSRTFAFKLISRLNNFPKSKKNRFFSKFKIKKAFRHAKLKIFRSVVKTLSFRARKLLKKRFSKRRRKSKFKVFKKFFRKRLKKERSLNLSFSRSWTWKFRNYFKIFGKKKAPFLIKSILEKYFVYFKLRSKRSSYYQFTKLKKKVFKSSSFSSYNFFAFCKLLKKCKPIKNFSKKMFRPRAYKFKKKFYYFQVYKRRLLIKCFRFSFFFYLFSKIWSIRRNTKKYSRFIKKLIKILTKFAARGNFVYILPFLINKNQFFGILSLLNSDFYSRQPFITANFSSVKGSKAVTFRLKNKI